MKEVNGDVILEVKKDMIYKQPIRLVEVLWPQKTGDSWRIGGEK